MRNALTKTLMCGVLATTFFLINCQKAPSRGVRAQKGGPTDTAGTQGKAEAPKDIVACTPEFLEKYKAADELLKQITKDANANLDDQKKEDLNKKIDEASAKMKEALDSIKKVKATADACSYEEPRTKKKNIYAISALQNQVDSAAALVKTKTGKESTASKDAEKRKNEKLVEGLKNGLQPNMVLVISEDLAKKLVSSNKGDVIAISEGQIQDFSQDIAKIVKDRSKTICQLADIDDKIEALKAGDKLKVTSYQHKDAKTKEIAQFILSSSDKLIRIECTLAKGKETSFASEFRKAFGEHLKAEALIEADKKKDEADKDAEARKVAELKEKDAKRAVAEKEYKDKDKAFDAATKKAEDAKQLHEKLSAELEKAKTDKNEAKIKELTTAVDAAKKSLDKANDELKAATEARQTALKAYEAHFDKEAI